MVFDNGHALVVVMAKYQPADALPPNVLQDARAIRSVLVDL